MSTDPLIDDVLAGEYVLGVMEDAERVAFERQLAQDPALKAAVARWTARFAELDGTAPHVQAPARLWGRIEQSIGAPRPRPASAPGRVSRSGYGRRLASGARPASRAPRRVWRSPSRSGRWRAAPRRSPW